MGIALNCPIASRNKSVNKQGTAVNANVVSMSKQNLNAEPVCPDCQGLRIITDCWTFLTRTPTDRAQTAVEHKLCFNCLGPGHRFRNCRITDCYKEAAEFIHNIVQVQVISLFRRCINHTLKLCSVVTSHCKLYP